jgi:hypothetical protein
MSTYLARVEKRDSEVEDRYTSTRIGPVDPPLKLQECESTDKTVG